MKTSKHLPELTFCAENVSIKWSVYAVVSLLSFTAAAATLGGEMEEAIGNIFRLVAEGDDLDEHE